MAFRSSSLRHVTPDPITGKWGHTCIFGKIGNPLGKGYRDAGAPEGPWFGPDLSIVFPDNLLHNGQPQAQSLDLLFGPEPSEKSEYLVEIFRVDADTVVTY